MTKLVVAGGRDYTNTPVDTVEIYNFENRAWEDGPQLPEPISRGSAVEFNGDLFIVGGQGTVLLFLSAMSCQL